MAIVKSLTQTFFGRLYGFIVNNGFGQFCFIIKMFFQSGCNLIGSILQTSRVMDAADERGGFGGGLGGGQGGGTFGGVGGVAFFPVE